MSANKKIRRKRWEIKEKEHNKMIEIMADIFYHHICQPQEDQNLSDNSICSSETLQLKTAA